MSLQKGPLSGIKIIEIEGIGPAPFCGMHFADLGAEVTVISRPEGNEVMTDALKGLLKRGKHFRHLDLKNPDDVEQLLTLAEGADGLFEGFRPGVMERLGLGPDICLARNPKLVYGRLTGWGQSGPLSQAAGHDLNYISLSSANFYAGVAGTPPLSPPTLVGDVGGGAHYLMIGMLAALLHAQTTGKGDVVDAAIVDGSAHMTNILLDVASANMMHLSKRGKSVLDGPHWYNAYLCADDKFITLGSVEPKFYQTLLGLLGLDQDDSFKEQYNAALWPQQAAKLATLFASQPQSHWCQLLEGSDACFAPVLSPLEAAQHPHMIARNVFSTEHGYLEASPAPRFQNYPINRDYKLSDEK